MEHLKREKSLYLSCWDVIGLHYVLYYHGNTLDACLQCCISDVVLFPSASNHSEFQKHSIQCAWSFILKISNHQQCFCDFLSSLYSLCSLMSKIELTGIVCDKQLPNLKESGYASIGSITSVHLTHFLCKFVFKVASSLVHRWRLGRWSFIVFRSCSCESAAPNLAGD